MLASSLISKTRALESALPNINISELFATAPQRILLGRWLTRATILPESQSKIRISFLPAPAANSKSYFLLNIATYKKGAMLFKGFFATLGALVG